MPFHARPISFKPPRLKGLSARLIASHYENNYGGAVRRLNAIRGELAALDPASAAGLSPERAEARGADRHQLDAAARGLFRQRWAKAAAAIPTGALAEAIARDFGSLAKWRAEFVAMGKALGGGSGWVVLTRSPRDGTLVNVWAADHTHSLAGGTPVLALDMYEHAYHIDFGATPAAYVDAFMANIAWERIAARFAGDAPAPSRTPSTRRPRAAMLDADPDLVVIDARLAADAATVPVRLRGARRAPPDKVDEVRRVAARGHQGPGLLRLGLRDRRRLRRQAARARHRRRRRRRRHRHLARRRPADRTAQGRRSDMKWVTRERPKIDRIACPWLIERFIEKQPEFLYVPADKVLSHRQGDRRDPLRHPRREVQPCRREVQLRRLHRRVQARRAGPRQAGRHRARRRHLAARPDAAVARPVRDLAGPQPRLCQDDHEMLKHGMVMYDALYAWCRQPGGRDARLAAEDGLTAMTDTTAEAGLACRRAHAADAGRADRSHPAAARGAQPGGQRRADRGDDQRRRALRRPARPRCAGRPGAGLSADDADAADGQHGHGRRDRRLDRPRDRRRDVAKMRRRSSSMPW